MVAMRFIIETTQRNSGDGWEVSIKQDGWTKTRTIRQTKHPESAALFPLPPTNEIPNKVSGSLIHSLCQGDDPDIIERLHHKIVRERQPAKEEMEVFGQYLFTALIGSDFWEQIKRRANGAPIELALCWPSTEKYLQRFPWEMMWSADRALDQNERPLAMPEGAYLATRTDAEISITRIVADGDPVPDQISGEPRLLFAVGCLLTDSQIAPGAEYFGLMRALEAETSAGIRGIHSRIIEKASPKKLKQAVEEFRPDVVHFICHGKNGSLELQLEQGDPKYGRETQACNGDDLAGILKGCSGNATLPKIVVLNACESGETGKCWDAEKTSCLASSLVRKGIPIVVAMGGEVADTACRLFSRAFGIALLKGNAVVPAAAKGRRQAYGPSSPKRCVDWIFPQLYVSRSVPPDFAPLKAQSIEATKQIRIAMGAYKVVLKNEPRLSARFDCLERFRALVTSIKAPETQGVLAIAGGSGYGKTRLLQEMTIITLYGGNLPITLINTSPQDEFKSLETVAKGFAGALRNAAKFHGVDDLSGYQTCRLRDWGGASRMPPSNLTDDVVDCLGYGEKDQGNYLTTAAILAALRQDLETLKHAAVQAQTRRITDDAIPVLLIDDFHLFPHNFIAEFFTNAEHCATTGHFGLGTTDEFPIPVVVALEYDGQSGAKVKSHIDQPQAWVEVYPLEAFPTDAAHELCVYGRVLLHPFNSKLTPTAWTRNRDPLPKDLKKWTDWFKLGDFGLQGTPRDFKNAIFYKIVDDLEDRLFSKADDEALLREIV